MGSQRAKEICKLVPSNFLKERIKISLLDEIALDHFDWEVLAPHICLTCAEQKEIKENFARQYQLQKREALRQWRMKLRDRATVESFIDLLCEQNEVKLAEMVAERCLKQPSCISVLAEYLRGYYRDRSSHPLRKQWSGQYMHFDLSSVYVDLKLHEVPLDETKSDVEKVRDRASMKEVKLSSAFEIKSNRLVVLFEGIAGSGKTTLSRHACEEWADGKLLQHFCLLIHVQVNKVKSAKSLQDLIPDKDEEARDKIAQAIIDTKGEKVCFLLDGLDEASKDFKSLLFDLLDDQELIHLSFIITSRPDGELLYQLHRVYQIHRVTSSKIVIDGFTSENLDRFLENSAQDDGEKAKMLVKQSPQLRSLCTLPLNAAVIKFLVHCFKDEIPVTQTELFNLLFCHICIRHMQSRAGVSKPNKIKRLPNDLPIELKAPFNKLCLLAYTAILENNRMFSSNDLRQANFDDCFEDNLGILQIHQNFTMYGLEEYYSFPHLALQQFLAAIHLSHQSDTEQVSLVQRIVQQDPLDELLPFHAGLACGEIRTKIIDCLDCRMSLDEPVIAEKIRESPTVSNDPRRKFLALCKCLYECQSESLLMKVTLETSNQPGFQQDQMIHYCVSIQNMWLSPLECLALGYVLRHKTTTLQKKSVILLSLESSISETSLIVLAKELRRDINYCTSVRIWLGLDGTTLGFKALMSLKELLKGQSNIYGFQIMDFCFDSSQIDRSIVFKHIIEGLSCNSSCQSIGLGGSSFNPTHICHLVLLTRSYPHLHDITLSSFNLHNCMRLLSTALSFSTAEALTLIDCNIDDNDLLSLGLGISKNHHLHLLIIIANSEINFDGFIEFLSLFINKESNLLAISTDPHHVAYLNLCRPEVLEQINDIRRQLQRRQLEVYSPFFDQQALDNIDMTLYLTSPSLDFLSRKERAN